MKIFFIFLFIVSLSTEGNSFENPKIKIENFFINKYEITIKEFEQFTKKNNYITLAEKNGGEYEWGAGWEKRDGWNYKNPYGSTPKSLLEPAVHINRFEAEKYCQSISGRLPTFEEWKISAYKQILSSQLLE